MFLGTLTSGDTWEIEYRILGKNSNALNLYNFEIRALVFGNGTTLLLKTANIDDGSDEQIKLLETKGTCLLQIAAAESKKIKRGNYQIEIELTNGDNKYTVANDYFLVKEGKIN
jgi:hypothetical protein